VSKVSEDPPGDIAALEADRASVERTSTAKRVADVLSTRVADGFFRPGARLSEKDICAALGVSRNTLREAFVLLTHNRLLTHELNRGVSVRVPTIDDVRDIYRVRRFVECGAVRAFRGPASALGPLEAAVREGEHAAAEERWRDLGTANMHFHRALVALGDSRRVDELMSATIAELRLVFHIVADPKSLHEPYLSRNAEILRPLAQGRPGEAERILSAYLRDSEHQLVTSYAERKAELDG
jgi:DNA-binding GntR family transcriptional regulator